MAKTPVFPGAKTLLFRSSAPKRTVDANDAPQSPGPELNIQGRRYRLVPVDAPDLGEHGHSAAEMLTPRELQIVALIADGRVNKQVADVLRISEWTVSTHLRRIFAKLGVDTRAAMVVRCFGALVAAGTEKKPV